MRLANLFRPNKNIAESIEKTSNNQLHKIDKLLFAYVNNERPDDAVLSIRVTEREHKILQASLNRKPMDYTK